MNIIDRINEVLTPKDEKRLDKKAKELNKKVSDILKSGLFDDLISLANEQYNSELLKAAKTAQTSLLKLKDMYY